MENGIQINEQLLAVEKNVNDFLEKISFKRTFPLDLINLSGKIGYKIYYISEKTEYVNKLAAAIDTGEKVILLNLAR